MAILEWKDDYSVGITVIDAEHRTLVAMINKAHESVDTTTTPEAVEELIADMKGYAERHFATEEAYMTAHDYPGTSSHVGEHKYFLKQVEEAETKFEDDRLVPGTVKVLAFLADWLVKHILQTDKLLGDYLKMQGVD